MECFLTIGKSRKNIFFIFFLIISYSCFAETQVCIQVHENIVLAYLKVGDFHTYITAFKEISSILFCVLIVYSSVKILRQLYAEIFGHLKSYSKVNKQYIKKRLQTLILTDIIFTIYHWSIRTLHGILSCMIEQQRNVFVEIKMTTVHFKL